MDNQNPAANNPQGPDRFVSDTERIIHRHLSNKDDVITEEDIRNVRIGVTPPQNMTTEQEAPDAVEEADENETANRPHQTEDPTTPWDVVEP